MNKVFEKIIDKLHNIVGCDATCDFDKGWNDAIGEAISIVQEVEKEYNNGWIPCSERLPEEPEEGLTDLDECDEYIVMIENADIPTALNYAGNSEWYRDGEFYNVIAWQPLPVPYKEKERSKQLEIGSPV